MGLLSALPRIVTAVEEGEGEGSFTVTFTVKKVKQSKKAGGGYTIAARLAPRERIPLEPMDYDVHIDDQGQLQLGLIHGGLAT